jgi:hypothetical protein
MPRKKPQVHLPLDAYQYDGLIVEIYADDQLPPGRGMHGRYKRIQSLHLALELLLNAKEEAKNGLRKQFFADIRISASALERALTQRHGRRHSIQIQQRICRSALRIYGMTGDDLVRLPYVFDSMKRKR